MPLRFTSYFLPAAVWLVLTACNPAADSQATGKVNAAADVATEARSTTVDPIYKDASQPTKDRIEDLIGRMTTAEKVAQVTGVWSDKFKFDNEDYTVNMDSIKLILPNGIGHVTRASELTGSGVFPGRLGNDQITYVNAIQKYMVENTRLGIPALIHEESLHGLAAKNATSWGQPISVAATFNPELTRELYAMAARQAASRGAHVVLTPVVDVARDPRWGRVEETLGEDPYLAAQIGLQAVLGFQGDDDKWDEGEVFATLKHMAGHGEPEGGNNIGPAHISERTLREVFLYPFKHIVQEGNVRNIMASYNEVNGVPSHANGWMLNDLLRDTWGYQGAVVSDYFAVQELKDRHAVAETYKQAAIQSISAGVDIELPQYKAFPFLIEAVENGEMDEQILNTAVARILQQKFDRGLFENPYLEEGTALENTPADDALVRRAGREGMILLKNEDNVLPLAPETSIALIGPNADKVLLGGYSDEPEHFITVRQGLEAYERTDAAEFTYSEGVRVTEPGSWYADPVVPADNDEETRRISAAVRAARSADVIVLAIGGNELTSREAWAESHMGDRPTLELVGRQNELIDELAKLGKPIVTLVFGGRPLDIRNALEKSDALFQCFYLGQETGHSVADVLYGEYAPGGKLPISMPRSVGHIPAYYNHKPTARRGYLFDDVKALFPFGYGLTYGEVTMGEPSLADTLLRGGAETSISIDVTNNGDMTVTEVVQLYVRDEFSSVTRPVKELRGFKKVELAPGQTKTVTLPVGREQLEFLDARMNWSVEPGTFKLMIGNSSRDEDLKTVSLRVGGDAK